MNHLHADIDAHAERCKAETRAIVQEALDRKFYVYAHRRNDTSAIFYIGKGCRDRAWDKARRNRFWKNIVSKHGYTVEIVEKELFEVDAFNIERELIKLHGRENLCNATDGGDGPSGYVHSKESREKMSISQKKKAPASAETRAKISAKGKGRVKSLEERAKLSVVNTGRYYSAETRAKISAAGIGRHCSVETRAKRSASLSGREMSIEAKLNISNSLKGHAVSNETRKKQSIANTGKQHSEESRAKISTALKGNRKSISAIINMTEAQRIRRWTNANGLVPYQNKHDLAKQAARDSGQMKFTGSKCKFGHDGIRYAKTGQCCFCVKLSNLSKKLKSNCEVKK